MCLFFLSCFLLAMKDDSIEGIYDTLKQCALISKTAGGIGLAISCIRATGSYIAGVSEIQIKSSRYRTAFYCLLVFALLTVIMFFQTNGNSNGLVPMLRVYNNTARYVDQGGNKVHFCIAHCDAAGRPQALVVVGFINPLCLCSFRDPGPSPCTWNRGTPMCLTS